MKHLHLYTASSILTLLVLFVASCSGQQTSKSAKVKKQTTVPSFIPVADKDEQIAEYIRNIYEDKNGNLWFGTNGYGVAHYDGSTVSYFSTQQGFDGHQVTGITEDPEQNIWFSTDRGIVKYDWTTTKAGEKRFTNYMNQQHLGDQRFWSIFADSKGTIWAGGVSGIVCFRDGKWVPFELPFPEKVEGEFITKGTSFSISEDRAGNLWFSTNGFGAFSYDGNSFTQYSDKDGLTDNSVDQVLEDSKGNVWFGTREGGLSRYDGNTFTNYTAQDSIGNNEVCVVYEDNAGQIWFSSEGYGVYLFDGKSFTNHGLQQGLKVRAVQTIFEDSKGRLWVGGGGGLYRFDGTSFTHVSKSGPWD